MYQKKIYRTLILLACTLSFLSCKRQEGIIPKDTMARIYYDIYITDEAVDSKYIYRKMADTMRVYEPIFNKYGYTTEDYNRSVAFYLERPDKFKDVFERTKEMLEGRRVELQDILEAEGKRPRLWSLVDSLELYTSDGIHIPRVFKNMRMMFFKPDSTVPCSPVFDSVFAERPVNTFLIFSDSAIHADEDFMFYKAYPFMDEIKRLIEIQDSIRLSIDSAAAESPEPATIPATIEDIRSGQMRETLKRRHNILTEPAAILPGTDNRKITNHKRDTTR